MDFVQAILGKYGMTRWRSRFQSLILRQSHLLSAEPEAVKPADTVIHNIHPVKEMHIHHYIDPPKTQVMTGPGTVNRRQHTIQGSGRDGTGSPASYLRTAGSQNLIHGLQERVWKQKNTGRLVTRGYRTLDPAESAVEPVTIQVAVSNQERTGDTPLTYLPPMPAAAPDGTDLTGLRIGSPLVPYSGDSRQGESLTGRAPQHLPAAHGQLQTLRTYILHQSADTVSIEQPLRQKLEPAANRYEQAGPPTMALLSHRGAVSGSAGTAAEAQLNDPSFRPSQGSRPLISPNLHLGLGQRLAAALDELKSRSEHLNPLLAEPAAVDNRLQQPDVMPLQLLAVPTELQPMVQRYSSARLSSASRPAHTGSLLSVAPQNGLIHTAKGQAVPSAPLGRGPGGRLITAGPEQEEFLQPAGRYSSLILRKPAAPKAARPEPVQQWPEPIFQERSAPPPSQSFPKAAAPAAKMDTAELNQLAERVYQVLEKKMAIRKDRRGLR
ncbi:hypothetical protein [Paenibacillus jilunlii]|nr:hypothetical protein [Paenibacillus jilunlii]SDL88468.1 hypothetical protein SAMN05216191_106282 [Paenibacillus jilunlii]